MSVSVGVYWLERLRKRWIMLAAAKVLLISLAVAITLGTLLSHYFSFGIPGFAISFVLSFCVLSLLIRYWAITMLDICRFVNTRFPEMEESAALLLIPADQLSGLQHLQASRVNLMFVGRKLPGEPFKQLLYPALSFILSLILLYVASHVPERHSQLAGQATSVSQPAAVLKEVVPTEISHYTISISPPAYTRKSSRVQKQFSIVAESGATVHWEIKTSKPVKKLTFIWNDKEVLKLVQSDHEGRSWQLNKVVSAPGFYQVVLDGKKSDLYQVEIIPDQPVAIKVIDPQQHSTIDVGQPKQVGLKLIMTDDYGISDAYISATVASGKGEAVNFKEKKISLNSSFKNLKSMEISQQLLLTGMGMKPGDELYFYINAKDNHGQQSRSDIYFVSIQDTTELMSMAAIDNGVNLVPEYFRSQRQIIIDTEKLLKEQGTLSDTEFKTRSNDLGVDQKMLRMRYGKFLGEETETSIGGEHEGADEGAGKPAVHAEAEHKSEPVEYGNVQSIMDQYAHKHDQAEDATFFEPQLKAQLKATLTEMWSSELQLRTFAPAKALPFEYKALRLLKDLQQKSRAFVAKTTIKTTPLKMEKRLSGELTAINETTNLSKNTRDLGSSLNLKESLTLLEGKLAGEKSSLAAIRILRVAERQLIQAAAAAPSGYLPALKSLKTVMAGWNSNKAMRTEITTAERGINSLLGNPQEKPFATTSQPSDLSKAYFNQLTRLSK